MNRPFPEAEASSGPGQLDLFVAPAAPLAVALLRLPSTAALLAQAAVWGRRLGYAGALTVRWNPRMRGHAGRALAGGKAVGVIELNPRLLARARGEVLATLAHELCHLAAGVRAGHGPKWRERMELLGFEPAVTHRMPAGDLRQKRQRWIWECVRCAARLTRAHRGVRRYRCRCGGSLRVAEAARGSAGR